MKKAATKKSPKAGKAVRNPLDALSINRRREWRLDLPLNALIEGKLPGGPKFSEVTKLENISSTGAYFCLDSGVIVGSKLNLMIDLPDNLTEGAKKKMRLGGITVRLEKSDKKSKTQGVAVRFTREFSIVPEPKKKKK